MKAIQAHKNKVSSNGSCCTNNSLRLVSKVMSILSITLVANLFSLVVLCVIFVIIIINPI